MFQPASLSSSDRGAQILAALLRRAVDRIVVFGGEDFGGNFVLELVEDRELPALRQAVRGELGILEVALRCAVVLAEEQIGIRPSKS